MKKNRIRVTSLSGCVTEILMLHRMTKVYQNYRFFWCIANFLLDTFSTSDTQFDLWSFLVHLYPDFQIQLFTPNKLCFDKVSPLCLSQAGETLELKRPPQTSCKRLYFPSLKPASVSREWTRLKVWTKTWLCVGEVRQRTMQGGSPKIAIHIKFNPGRQWWATYSCEWGR